MLQENDLAVWFVGSNPSRKNTNPNLPFWGTRSYEVLKDWMEVLGVNKHGLLNVSNEVTDGDVPEVTDYDLANVKSKLSGETIVIALGNTASLVLNRLGIKHFKLPHPSGRNRLLNDKKYVAIQLESCKNYIVSRRGDGK